MAFKDQTSSRPQLGTDAGRDTVGYGQGDTGRRGVTIVQQDTVLTGEIRGCRLIEIHGEVEGDLKAEMVLVHESGKLHGTVRADNAEIRGILEGTTFVKHLLNIDSTGTVTGNIQYGQLKLEFGGSISAELRNVPPELAGDFDLEVKKGRAVRITTTDLTAIDPDDEAEDLTYTVTNMANGFVALSTAPAKPVDKFTQADLENGGVNFVHDGSDTKMASFDVVVADDDGATSGAAQTVKVTVKS
ncbi:hypothetical protein MnTg02_03271 [bacterium MnTg02]|nr:hypothetical protein MnTg02_03271 [bacterium MnTg02]